MSDRPDRLHAGTTLLRVRNAARSAFTELRHPAERRIPVLDGLRALAILLVINHHVAANFEEQFGSTAWTRSLVTTNGWMGVDLFFVLSGFFIGTQLWRELQRTGSVSLPEFLLRRTLRIWPLYFATYAVVLLTLPHMGAAKHYGWTDLVFLVNYLGGGVVAGGWSLSTEEQFYLVTPLLLLLFRRRSLQWFRWMLAALWFAEIAVRIAEYVHRAGAFHVKDAAAFQHLYYPFHTHSDGLIAGLLVANLVVAARQKGAAEERAVKRPWLVMFGGIVAMGLCWKLQSETLNFAGLGLLFGSVVWWSILCVPQWMRGHGFYLLSRLSFGMYLNHAYLLRPAQAMIATMHPGPASAGWLVLLETFLLTCLSALLACATFVLVEHPFLLWRTVLLRRRAVAPLVAH